MGNRMIASKLNLENWNIVKDDFIDLDKSLLSQKDLLYEDMFQVSHEKANYTIDIGWYGGDFNSGHFTCYLIKGIDWDNPIIRKETREIKDILPIIERLRNHVEEL